MMNKEKLINKWQIDIANCEQIINHCSVTEKTMEFTKGELNAISDCLKELKNLTIPVVNERTFRTNDTDVEDIAEQIYSFILMYWKTKKAGAYSLKLRKYIAATLNRYVR